MDKKDILHFVDHTNLRVNATRTDILNTVTEASENGCASVCIPPCYVAMARERLNEIKDYELGLCTVIGFPNGYMSANAKVMEAQDALLSGATEIDMVANIGYEQMIGDTNELLVHEIHGVKEKCNQFSFASGKDIILKVIIETSMLNKHCIQRMCDICYSLNVDYIKTSTGFNNGGATKETVGWIRDYITNKGYDKPTPHYTPLQIKASGGIKTLEDAEEYITKYGVTRIGASGLI